MLPGCLSCFAKARVHRTLHRACESSVRAMSERDRQAHMGSGMRFREKLFVGRRPREWPAPLAVHQHVYVQPLVMTSSSSSSSTTTTMICYLLESNGSIVILAACGVHGKAGHQAGLVFVAPQFKALCEHTLGKFWRRYLEKAFDPDVE